MSGGSTATAAAAITETHVSTVVLIGERAYKLKKPVQLGFLDFRDRAARWHACHQEVRLNRRLAPDVYLGVADVTGVDGEPCDHMVVMRRMPEARRLSTLVRHADDVSGCLRAVARALASFHARADRGADVNHDATAEAVRALWDVNLAQLRPYVGEVLDPERIALVRCLAGRYLHGRATLFQQRIEEGHAVDGHGDLLADDVYCLDDGPRILDCLEFDPHLRHGDRLLDVAMLVMDLERLGRHDLGLRFLDAYREFSGLDHPQSLLHHYVAYRATVRCKIACLRHAQGDAAAAAEASDLLEIAVSHLERSSVNLLVVGGVPGTGKTTLARAVGDALGIAVLRSDELRDHIVGPAHRDVGTEAFEDGRYARDAMSLVYAHMLRRAEHLLRRGESVVLDATWRDPLQRQLAALTAARTGAALTEVRCEVPEPDRRDRIAARARHDADGSEATAAIADRIAAVFAPWPSATVVDTTEPLLEQVDAVIAGVERG